MAWYPGATKMELQPESDAQPAIRPTQLIFHSIVAPWTPRRTYEYWRSSALESHFGLGYDGDIAQYIGTETRADANAQANRRPDGTGAVSVETASNTSASDPWTAAQVEELIKLGVWMHTHHEVPLRICRSHSDPGFGYHRLFPEWSTGGTVCPGNARVRQFREVVFPGIVARATGKTTPPEEDTVALTDSEIKQIVDDVYEAVCFRDGRIKSPDPTAKNKFWMASSYWRDTYIRVRNLEAAVDALGAPELTDAQVAVLADKVAAHPALTEQIAEAVASKLAERLAE